MWRIGAVATLMLALLAPAVAEEAPWQDTVTGQIEAMRGGDGAMALSFAGAGFRTHFDGQPDAFMVAIVATGYGPIMESRSHSFGPFDKISETSVMQVVKLVGEDQGRYEALYQLVDEPDVGWRVQGVALRREAGVGI